MIFGEDNWKKDYFEILSEGEAITHNKRQMVIVENKQNYLDENYETHIVEYFGDIRKAIENLDYASIIESESFYSTISIKRGMLSNLLKDVEEIVNVEKNHLYTLSKLEVVNNAYDNNAIDNKNVNLYGEGVVVGIVGTGIDYLNERFITEDGRSRVISIWDQTLEGGTDLSQLDIGYGSLFSKEKIQEAIGVKKQGGNPYDIVPHRDEVGHGTAIAGIVGARNFGAYDDMNSVAPKCEFAIVKVKEAKKINLELNGIGERTTQIYEGADIGFAIKYLAKLQLETKKPMVVYLPLGSNCSGHDGHSALERYAEFYERRRGFILVTDCGDEGNSETHTSGALAPVGKSSVVVLSVDEKEINFCISIWISRPNKVAVGIIAPSGETLEKLPIPTYQEGEATVNIGSYQIRIQTAIQEETGGEQVVFIYGKGNIGGIWQFIITSEYAIDGRYNCWILQKKLLKENTKFIIPDPYITLTIPSTGVAIGSTAYYNQRNNTVVAESGKGYTRDGRVKPGVASPGVDILTVGKNNSMIVTKGAAAAGGILTGATALLLEWGIVQGNDENLFGAKAGNYIIRGTKTIKGVTFPNPDWGYGILSISKLYEVLINTSNNKPVEGPASNKRGEKKGNIYIRIPAELFEWLI